MKDTRTTAYALNELQGNEREKFESDLAADRNLQHELSSASRVADGLAQVMGEPVEGLEPRAREKLLRAMAANQEAWRAQRKAVRWAMPVSMAAAASIAVLLWITGGMTPQGPAMTAAGGERSGSGGLAAEAGPGGEIGSFRTTDAAGRTIHLSESARAAREMRAQGSLSLTSPAVRTKSPLWNNDLPMWGDADRNQ